MKISLIVLNLFAAFLVYLGMRLLDFQYPNAARLMYTELTAYKVIDDARLQEVLPLQGKLHSRQHNHALVERLVGHPNISGIVCYPCMFVFILNAFLIGRCFDRTQKAEPRPPAQPSSAGASEGR